MEYGLLIAAGAVLVIVAILFFADKIDDLVGSAGNAPPTVLKPPVALCDPSYAGACIPSPPPDLDCEDLQALGVPLPVDVVGDDPHGLDPDGDGFGC